VLIRKLDGRKGALILAVTVACHSTSRAHGLAAVAGRQKDACGRGNGHSAKFLPAGQGVVATIDP